MASRFVVLPPNECHYRFWLTRQTDFVRWFRKPMLFLSALKPAPPQPGPFHSWSGGGGVGKTASVCVQLSFVRRRTCLLLWIGSHYRSLMRNLVQKCCKTFIRLTNVLPNKMPGSYHSPGFRRLFIFCDSFQPVRYWRTYEIFLYYVKKFFPAGTFWTYAGTSTCCGTS
jgi:hypothetical protein